MLWKLPDFLFFSSFRSDTASSFGTKFFFFLLFSLWDFLRLWKAGRSTNTVVQWQPFFIFWRPHKKWSSPERVPFFPGHSEEVTKLKAHRLGVGQITLTPREKRAERRLAAVGASLPIQFGGEFHHMELQTSLAAGPWATQVKREQGNVSSGYSKHQLGDLQQLVFKLCLADLLRKCGDLGWTTLSVAFWGLHQG